MLVTFSAVGRPTYSYTEIDGVIFSAGIQRHIDFTKPETVDLDCELRLSGPTPQLMLTPTQSLTPRVR